MDSIKINKVQIRNLQIEDYDQLAQSFTDRETDPHLPRGTDRDGGR